MDDIFSLIPDFLSGAELENKLRVTPPYNKDMRMLTKSEKLFYISDMFDYFYPSSMAKNIYVKLYMALCSSLKKKNSKEMKRQYYENRKTIIGQQANYIVSGTDSFTITGPSGIGKSLAINRAISIITNDTLTVTVEPYTKIIPLITVQCPFDCSVKGMLLEILRKTDELLGTQYLLNANIRRETTDMLIGTVAQVSANHIGVLIVDEIQNVVSNKNGDKFVASLTQLINSTGISVCMVGTPECRPYFEKSYQIARRGLGLDFDALPLGEEFRNICSEYFSYQYTSKYTPFSEELLGWFYLHTQGNISILIMLMQKAQETALINDMEQVTIELLNSVFEENMNRLTGFIDVSGKHYRKSSPKNSWLPVSTSLLSPAMEDKDFHSLLLSKLSLEKKIELLKDIIDITEVNIE